MSAPTSEVLAAWELERLMQKAAATRFERTRHGFVCANPELPSVWSASRMQVEPDGEAPTPRPAARDGRAALGVAPRASPPDGASSPTRDANREVAWSLARDGWDVTELWLLICRVPPKVPAAGEAGRGCGNAPPQGAPRRRARPAAGQDRPVRPLRRAARPRGGSLRLRRLRGRAGRSRSPRCSCAATSPRSRTSRRSPARAAAGSARRPSSARPPRALRLSARAVYLFAEPDVAKRFYLPMGFEQIGPRGTARRHPPGEERANRTARSAPAVRRPARLLDRRPLPRPRGRPHRAARTSPPRTRASSAPSRSRSSSVRKRAAHRPAGYAAQSASVSAKPSAPSWGTSVSQIAIRAAARNTAVARRRHSYGTQKSRRTIAYISATTTA